MIKIFIAFLFTFSISSVFAQPQSRYYSLFVEGGYADKGYSGTAGFDIPFFDHWKAGFSADYIHQSVSRYKIPVNDYLATAKLGYQAILDDNENYRLTINLKGSYGKEIINNDEAFLNSGVQIVYPTDTKVKALGFDMEIDRVISYAGKHQNFISVYARPWITYFLNSNVGDLVYGANIGLRLNIMK